VSIDDSAEDIDDADDAGTAVELESVAEVEDAGGRVAETMLVSPVDADEAVVVVGVNAEVDAVADVAEDKVAVAADEEEEEGLQTPLLLTVRFTLLYPSPSNDLRACPSARRLGD
jgi:hypothetical protein